MFRTLFFSLLLGAAVPLSSAGVARLAPGFTWEDASGKAQSLQSLRGQPVILLFADSARSGRLKAQIARLEDAYRFSSARHVVFAVALRSEAHPLKTDIPFVHVQSGPEVAQRYELERGFGIAIIGPDGNVDYITRKVLPGERVRDVVNNSFVRQEAVRARK